MHGTMSMLVNFSSELRTWILHNLTRGCAQESLVEGMVSQGFEQWVAHGLVEAFAQALEEGAEPPQDCVVLDSPLAQYRYETPRLPGGPVIRTADRDIPVLLRMEQPVMALLHSVLSEEECDELIDLARDRLRPSTVVDPETGEDKVAEHRDSEGMFFAREETPFIAKLDRRISQLMNSPVENGEGLQVLRYGPGAKNTPHFDFLVPSNQANRNSLARSGQRISTLVVYLNHVKNGGETLFPKIGLAVSPNKGNAAYFEYANSQRQVDPLSVHSGGVVLEGEKWVVTKWMREKRFTASC